MDESWTSHVRRATTWIRHEPRGGDGSPGPQTPVYIDGADTCLRVASNETDRLPCLDTVSTPREQYKWNLSVYPVLYSL